MIPLRLRLRNFMSYGEDVLPLDFSQVTTACMTGDNGHGKSTLLDAITWSLWGKARARNLDDVVRLGQTEAEVEFEFELEGEHYRVLRKRSLRTRAGQSALELQGFDKTARRFQAISGNSIRETEAKIVQLLRMNYETFINSVFILQGRADEFTTRQPGERKRILAEILGLSLFDELETRARAHRNELDQDVKTLLMRLEELEQAVARKDELAAIVQQHQEALLQLQNEGQAAQERVEQLRQQHNALELQSQRVKEAAQRLQVLRQEDFELTRQLQSQQSRLTDYEAVLQQEAMIVAGYAALQRLQEEERAYSIRGEEFARLQQRQTTLQQAITTAQHRLELDYQSASQRLQEIHSKIQGCETILADAGRITDACRALQEARQRDAQLAQALQQRYVLEQEKNQVERRIQMQRHKLELEQRPRLDRQKDWESKQAALPTWHLQTQDLRQQLAEIEHHEQRREQVRSEGVALKVQVEESIPQTLDSLQREIHEHEEKRALLQTAGAHCPLCEKVLTDGERRRVMGKLAQEIDQRSGRIQELQREQQRLQARRQTLRLEFKQLEQHLEQRKQLEQQLATVQASLEEATRAREHLTLLLEELRQLETQLSSGSYARDELAQLQQLTAELAALAYNAQEHDSIRQTLTRLTAAEIDYARLQQAETEITTWREQDQQGAQQVAMLEHSRHARQFAVAEQRDLQDTQEAIAQLDFNPAVHTAMRKRIQEQQHLERLHMELENARQQVEQVRTTRHDLEARKQRCTDEIAALEHEQHTLATDLKTLGELRQRLAEAELQARRWRDRDGDTRLALGRAQAQYEHCLQQEAEWLQRRAQRDQLVTERTLYSDLVQMFGKNGIQAIIIENAIPELEEEANRILSRVSDNAMHLTLETQRDTRSGNVAETLDIRISDALGTRNYEMFSGGEAFRINFALRIALSKLLARRAGARLRTLVIDEGFGTQDSQGLERLVEVIKAIQDDFAKIIVITHLRELKNSFDTHIEVKKDPVRGSWYEVLS
jgi:exonuclease SbcC